MSELIRSPKQLSGKATVAISIVLPLLLLVALFRLVGAAAEQAPSIDLNGDLGGSEYMTTYTEDEGAKPIVSTTGLSVIDQDSENLAWARATLTTLPDGALEALSAEAGATGITVKYKPATGALELTGEKSVAAYQEVLRTVTYVNTSQGPDTSDRLVVFDLYDGTSHSVPVTSTVTINAVNDAPVLDNTGAMMLVDINENVFDSLGNRVETIIASAGGDRITDPDKDAVEGLAIIEVGSSNGMWQYSLDAGATWITFENVSNQSAVLLNPVARIRFVPKPQFSGSANITFRAWDQTQGINGDIGVDVTVNGGSTPYSLATENASINIITVDDPPIVDLNGPDQGASFSAGYLGSGVPVPISDQDATVSDPDSQLLTTATFRLTNHPDGALESLTVDVSLSSITVVPYDPATGLLVLNGPDTIESFQQALRTAAYVNTAIMPSSGARIIEVTMNDGLTDSAVVTSTIQINPDNKAPVLNAPGGLLLSNVNEDAIDSPGNTVAAMLASNGGDPITDEDANALEGIAIVAADNTRGAWEYSSLAPPNWQPVGIVSGTAAILLSTESLIRFVPHPDYAGPSGNLTFRAWDQTTGTNGQRNVNASVNGGSSAFSVQTAVASLMVTAINDAPVINYTPSGPLVYQEDSPPLPLLAGTLVITDVDNANLASATTTLVNRPNGDAETLAVEVGGTGLVATYLDGILQLTGSASADVYRQALASLSYVNVSQDPDIADRQIQITVSDGATVSAALALTVGIVATNDPPIVDLNGVGPGVDFSTNFYIQWRPAKIADPNMALIDQDDTSLLGVTVRLVNPVDGAAESLIARVLGSNIKQNYDPATGILQLTGIDSVSNYQNVVRSVTYNNILESPTLDVRTVEFQTQDAFDFGPVSKTTISIQPTPTATLFMPLVGRRSEEPNDVCGLAPATSLNRDEKYFADDRDDWFYFDLAASATVVVRLRDFAPGEGQLIVASGSDCTDLELLGNSGDNQTNKTVDLGPRGPGRFYVWIINDGAPNTVDPYILRVDATP